MATPDCDTGIERAPGPDSRIQSPTTGPRATVRRRRSPARGGEWQTCDYPALRGAWRPEASPPLAPPAGPTSRDLALLVVEGASRSGSRPSPRDAPPDPTVRLGWRARLADPMATAVLALGITQITAWGTSYYCLGILAGPITRTPAGAGASCSSASPSPCSSWASCRRGGPRHRPARRARGDDARHRARVGRPLRARPRPERGRLPGGVGVPRPRHAPVPVRRRVRRPGAGHALARSEGDLLPHAVRSVRVIGVLGGRARAGRAGRLAADPRPVRSHRPGGLLPLHWLGLARREPAEGAGRPASPPAASPDGPPLEGRTRSVAIVLFAIIMSLNGFTFGVISVRLIPLLEAAGLATAAAVWVASMKGVAQFGGRVVEIVFARNLRAITVGRIRRRSCPPRCSCC